MSEVPDLPEFADKFTEFQSDPKITRFTRFSRSEIATLLLASFWIIEKTSARSR